MHLGEGFLVGTCKEPASGTAAFPVSPQIEQSPTAEKIGASIVYPYCSQSFLAPTKVCLLYTRSSSHTIYWGKASKYMQSEDMGLVWLHSHFWTQGCKLRLCRTVWETSFIHSTPCGFVSVTPSVARYFPSSLTETITFAAVGEGTAFIWIAPIPNPPLPSSIK